MPYHISQPHKGSEQCWPRLSQIVGLLDDSHEPSAPGALEQAAQVHQQRIDAVRLFVSLRLSLISKCDHTCSKDFGQQMPLRKTLLAFDDGMLYITRLEDFTNDVSFTRLLKTICDEAGGLGKSVSTRLLVSGTEGLRESTDIVSMWQPVESASVDMGIVAELFE